MNYKIKYLKYKHKYLALKGGTNKEIIADIYNDNSLTKIVDKLIIDIN